MPTPIEHYETAETLLELGLEASRLEGTAGATTNARELLAAAGVHATLAAVPWARDDAQELALGLDRDDVATLVDVVAALVEWVDRGGHTALPADDVDAEAYVAGAQRATFAVADLVRIARPVLEAVDR